MGLPVGKLEIASAIASERYEIQATGRLAGLSGVFASGKGGAVASGTLRDGNLAVSNAAIRKSTFEASMRFGKSSKLVKINTTSGNVSSLEMEPPMDDKPGRIPVLPEHKRSVVDPLSAILMPMVGTNPKAEDCNRTIPVFDGGARLNIVMSYAETKQVETAGFRGEALVCHVRYVPLAGHRPDRAVIKYMEENRDMMVWLAPIKATSFLIPVKVSVKTSLGIAVLEAEKWSVTAEAP